MLDEDLAALYGVETRIVKRGVSRNWSRFPPDFAFRLTRTEFESLQSQIGIANKGHGGRRDTPLAFTQEGVAMLSSVLNSERAIMVNVAIMRAFVRLRQAGAGERGLRDRVAKAEFELMWHERELGEHEAALNEVFATFQRKRLPKKR